MAEIVGIHSDKDPKGKFGAAGQLTTAEPCKVTEALLEDSLGGPDKNRLEDALKTCECDSCS